MREGSVKNYKKSLLLFKINEKIFFYLLTFGIFPVYS